LGLERAWRGFWARPVIFHEINKFLQISQDPDVRFQCAQLHGETLYGTQIIPSLSIGPPTLLNDCNHFATAIFRRSAIQSFSILVASVLVQRGIATNEVDRPLRYNQRRSWLPIFVSCTKNMGYFLIVRSSLRVGIGKRLYFEDFFSSSPKNFAILQKKQSKTGGYTCPPWCPPPHMPPSQTPRWQFGPMTIWPGATPPSPPPTP